MEEKHLLSLEYNKILEIAASNTACSDAHEAALEIRPVSDLEKARRLMNETSDAHMLMARFGAPSFGGLYNVNNCLALAENSAVLSASDLLKSASTLRAIRMLAEWYTRCSSVANSLDILFSSLRPDKALEERIFSVILSEDTIADDASAELKSIRKQLKGKELKIREQLDRIIRSPNYKTVLQDAIITIRNGRFVVPVKYECRTQLAGLVQDSSSSGSTVFIEPMSVVEANNDIKVLLGREKEEIDRILAELSALLGESAAITKGSYECAVELDLIFAKAQTAYQMKAVVPHLTDDGVVELYKCRHPLIDPKQVVAIDIALGRDYDTLVITGPNTGGKTVSIKTMGLICAMAASGFMIPASEESNVSVFDNIFADIGDEQSIEQSLSTFSSHMTNIVDIMQKTDRRTLVLIDELGAGTDPIEGAALAMAILSELAKRGAKIAATTHYAELKEYAISTDRVENAGMEFDIKTLRPTYRLLTGIPGRSNAFAISERLGLSPDVIAKAKELIEGNDDRFETVIGQLEDSRSKAEKSLDAAKQNEIDSAAMKEKAQKTLDGIDKMKEEELEKAKGESLRIIENAKREAYAFLDDLDRLKKEKKNAVDLAELSSKAKSDIKKHMNAMDEISDPVREKLTDEEYVLPRELRIGDNVIIADMGTEGVVTALPDKSSNVEVTAGIMKTRVPLSNIRLSDKKPKKNNSGTRNTRNMTKRSEMNIVTELDLRGMASDEAIMTLDRFIDVQLRSGVDKFTVIHGKGTGVLRKAVASYLSKCKYVKEYRLGAYGEGEDGVTVVTLK